MPHLIDLYRKHEKRGLKMVLVSEESLDVLRRFAQGSEVPFPILSDPTGATFKAYQADALPRTVLVTREGGIAAVLPGYQEEAFHQQFVPAVEKAFRIRETREEESREASSSPDPPRSSGRR